MTLTPQDVQNKEFLTVRLREGYDMQEVDEFLDEVEAELRRLLAENDSLRETAEAQPARVEEQPPADVESAREAAEEARVTDTTIQRAVADDVDVPQRALTILTHAQTAADNLIDEAQAKADELITDATSKADSLVGDATSKAQALDEETEQRRTEMMGALQAQESELRTKIDDLRAHEREYRSRLVAYHAEQVRRLQEGQPDDPDVEAPGSAEGADAADASLGSGESSEDS